MLINRNRQRREVGMCQYCSDPRPTPLDEDGRCSACQGSAKIFLSQIDEPSPEPNTGGRPIDLDPSISIPLLIDPDLGRPRAQRLALIMDSACNPIVLRPDSLPIYSLRLRPLLANWLKLNILNSRDSLSLYRQHKSDPGEDLAGPWATYHFSKTMDIYILSRILAAHSMELRAYARNVVFEFHKKYGPVQEWDRALGLHPLDDTTGLVFEWPCWLTLPPGLYGMPTGTPVPSLERSVLADPPTYGLGGAFLGSSEG